MNLKYIGCKIENCNKKHKGHGYCVNHLAQSKRGTLEIYPHSKLCEHPKCFNKYYGAGYCISHRQRKIKNLPMDMKEGTKDEYQRGNLDFEHKDQNSWSKSVKSFFTDKCMICNWDEAPCDVHHIISKTNNGPSTLQNAAILCPNHHRLAHKNKISVVELQNTNKIKIENIQI